MRSIRGILPILGLVAVASSARAQTPDYRAEFLFSIGEVEKKVLDLTEKMTEARWDWKPEGARSTCEVMMHMALDKYLFGSSFGLTRPATLANDQCPANKAQARAALVQAFKEFNDAVKALPATSATDEVTLFGRKMTRAGLLLVTAEHAGEHLGQLIAYARMQGVVPPWSR